MRRSFFPKAPTFLPANAGSFGKFGSGVRGTVFQWVFCLLLIPSTCSAAFGTKRQAALELCRCLCTKSLDLTRLFVQVPILHKNVPPQITCFTLEMGLCLAEGDRAHQKGSAYKPQSLQLKHHVSRDIQPQAQMW